MTAAVFQGSALWSAENVQARPPPSVRPMANAQVRHQPLSKSHASPVLEAALRRPRPVLAARRRTHRQAITGRYYTLFSAFRATRPARLPYPVTAPGPVPNCAGACPRMSGGVLGVGVWVFGSCPIRPVRRIRPVTPRQNNPPGPVPHVIGGCPHAIPTPFHKMRIRCGILFRLSSYSGYHTFSASVCPIVNFCHKGHTRASRATKENKE